MKIIDHLHEKTEKKIKILNIQGKNTQKKWLEDSYKYTFAKNSKKIEKLNFSIFMKKLQKEDEKLKNKRERSFAELYEVKRLKFQENLKNLLQINNLFGQIINK